MYAKLAQYYEDKAETLITPNYRKLNLVALTIADTHSWAAFNPDKVEKHFMDAPSYDVVLMLGDISAYDLEVISKYIEGIPTLFVAGNHDDPYMYIRRGYIDVSKRRVYLRNSYGDKVRFVGLDGSFCYKPGDNYPCYRQSESLLVADALHPSDVFISHDGPFDNSLNYSHKGMIGISKHILCHGPCFYHLHGHRHIVEEEEYKTGCLRKGCYMLQTHYL